MNTISPGDFHKERADYLAAVGQCEPRKEPSSEQTQQDAIQADYDRVSRFLQVDTSQEGGVLIQLHREEVKRLFDRCCVDERGVITPSVWDTLVVQSQKDKGRVIIPEPTERRLPDGLELFRLLPLSSDPLVGEILVTRQNLRLCGIAVWHGANEGGNVLDRVRLQEPIAFPVNHLQISPGVQKDLSSWWRRFRLGFIPGALTQEDDQYLASVEMKLPGFHLREEANGGKRARPYPQYLPFVGDALVPAQHLLDQKASKVPKPASVLQAGERQKAA